MQEKKKVRMRGWWLKIPDGLSCQKCDILAWGCSTLSRNVSSSCSNAPAALHLVFKKDSREQTDGRMRQQDTQCEETNIRPELTNTGKKSRHRRLLWDDLHSMFFLSSLN